MADWVFLGTVLLVLATAAAGLFRLRTRRIARARAGESYRDFAAHFSAQGIEEVVLLAVYRYFQHRMRWDIEGFPVRPSDEIAGIYGIADDDLDDAIEELLTGRELPTPFILLPRVRTVEDLVRLVASRPRLEDGRPPYQGRCPRCSYDLTGNVSSICPECGAALASPTGYGGASKGAPAPMPGGAYSGGDDTGSDGASEAVGPKRPAGR